MRDINTTTFSGRLGRDIELRFSSEGKPIASMNVAISRDDFTTWIKATVFGKTAEIAAQYLKKGSRVGITGYLRENSWTDKEGNKKTTIEVVANQIVFLDPRPQETDAPF